MQYLRYTIVHHDVREHFGLTMCEYMVCDSIHQLSHSAPTKQPNVKIAKHLGIDEGSVRNAKKKLVEKGVIAEVDGGFTSTEKWNHFVTFRKNSEPIRKNSDSYNIYKDNITTEATASEEIRVVKDDQEKVDVRKAVETVVGIFKEVTGRYSSHWKIRTNQRVAAANLLADNSEQAIRKALTFYMEHKDIEFCPQINSPLDLEEKWYDLIDFRDKQ